jgi:cytoplasmic tRNA 2-thiolation protein 2
VFSRYTVLRSFTVDSVSKSDILKPQDFAEMPSAVLQDVTSDDVKLCKRCGLEKAEFAARQDTLCKDCFVRFINTKVIKRIEATSFRVRDSTRNLKRKLLLPVSGGVSSVTQLHILDGHLEAQILRTGRAAFEIAILIIDDGSHDQEELNSFWEVLRKRYPKHEYRISPLIDQSDAIESDEDASISITRLTRDLKMPTSRSDVASISLTQAIAREAHSLACDGILWGDTTTRLAEKILAATALGRGATLPWLVNDGPSPYILDDSSETVLFIYPMKDILRKELEPYRTIQSLPTLSAVEQGNIGSVVSSKNATIDSLMKEYFEGVEKDYPSIVTNVVRTSSKLRPLRGVETGLSKTSLECELCGVPVPAGTFGIHGWGGSQELQGVNDIPSGLGSETIPTNPVAATSYNLCYGCARSTLRT